MVKYSNFWIIYISTLFIKYYSLNQKVRSTNTKYLLKRRHEAFCKTSLHYQVIIKVKYFNLFILVTINVLREIIKLRIN